MNDTSLVRIARMAGGLYLAIIVYGLFSETVVRGQLIFAISNLILGYLVARSTFLPTVLGVALQLAGVVYLAGSHCRFLFPDYLASLQPAYIVPFIAELSFCLWLLTKGVKTQTQ